MNIRNSQPDETLRSEELQEDALSFPGPAQLISVRRSRPHKLAYSVVIPLAALFTIGLTLSMAALIASEFTPQEKAEDFAFQINPVELIVSPPDAIEPPEALLAVEVPPPPPALPVDNHTPVIEPQLTYSSEAAPFVPTRLVFAAANSEITISDRDAKPFLRVPPAIPPRFSQGDHSGQCKVRFDVSPEGQPFNIQTLSCTSKLLKTATVRSVQNWKYTPKIAGGRAVARSGVESTIRFTLNDATGRALPLPRGT